MSWAQHFYSFDNVVLLIFYFIIYTGEIYRDSITGQITITSKSKDKSAGKGGATGFFIVTETNLLRQMYLSTHPPCGFGWIEGHVTSRNQGLCSNV